MVKRRSYGSIVIVPVGLAGILCLALAGSQSFGLAVLGAPLAMGLVWWMIRRLSLGGILLAGALAAGLMAVSLTPTPGKFFGAAVVTGLLLPLFEKYRPQEDDWFYAVPLCFLAVLAVFSGLDALARNGAVWSEYRWVVGQAVEQGRQLNDEGLAGRVFRAEDTAAWSYGQILLPWRMMGACFAGLCMALYLLLRPFRSEEETMHAPVKDFTGFHTKRIYLLILLCALCARIAWHYHPQPVLAYAAHGLLFFAGTGLFLQAVAIGAWFARRAEVAFPVLLSSTAALTAVLAAPALAAPIAMIGLADVWLDFRRLD